MSRFPLSSSLVNLENDLSLTTILSLVLYLDRMMKVAKVNWFVDSAKPLRALVAAVEEVPILPVRTVMCESHVASTQPS